MLEARNSNPAFHPLGEQRILNENSALFTLLRTSQDGHIHTLCLTNVTDQTIEMSIDQDKLPEVREKSIKNILNAAEYSITNGQLNLTIEPYQVIWLKFS